MSVARDRDTLLRAAARLEIGPNPLRAVSKELDPQRHEQNLRTAAWLRQAAEHWSWVRDPEALAVARTFLAETA